MRLVCIASRVSEFTRVSASPPGRSCSTLASILGVRESHHDKDVASITGVMLDEGAHGAGDYDGFAHMALLPDVHQGAVIGKSTRRVVPLDRRLGASPRSR